MSGAETVRVLKDAINSRRVFSVSNNKYNPINVSDIKLDEDDEVTIKLNNMETDVTEISIENQEKALEIMKESFERMIEQKEADIEIAKMMVDEQRLKKSLQAVNAYDSSLLLIRKSMSTVNLPPIYYFGKFKHAKINNDFIEITMNPCIAISFTTITYKVEYSFTNGFDILLERSLLWDNKFLNNICSFSTTDKMPTIEGIANSKVTCIDQSKYLPLVKGSNSYNADLHKVINLIFDKENNKFINNLLN